jgi:hypothetical protein
MNDTYYFMWQMAQHGCAVGGPGALDFTALLCEEPGAYMVRIREDRRP